jgi:hypothetical protein
MITLAWYLLKVIICSGILCGYYFLALRNKAFHRWNRFYLLAAVVISLLAPIIKIDIFQNNDDKGTLVQMLQTISYGDEAVIEYSRNSDFQLNTENVAESAYLLVSLIFLAIFFVSLFKIKRMRKKYPQTKIEDISFINTNAKGTPFSFFRSIFWNNAIDLHSKPGQQIFNHEIAHVKEKHSYDKIFMNIVLIFFWINPFFWLMRKELYMIHEFIADKEALEDSDINAFAEMILQTVYPGQNFSLTNNFFYSPIKRRILMLTKNKNPKVSYVSRLLVLPLAAIVFFAFTIKLKTEKPVYNGKMITVGGDEDNSAKAADIEEKMTKKVTEKATSIVVGLPAEKNAVNMHREYSKIKIFTKSDTANPVYYVDGKEISQNEMKKINPNKIESISILTGESAKKIYGKKGKNGIIQIKMKPFNVKPVTGIQQDTIPGKVFTKVENEASFPGGQSTWLKYITRQIQASIDTFTNVDYGTCVVRFIVNTDGSVSDVKATTMQGTKLAQIAVKAIKEGPKWIPASQNGHTVASYRLQPVTLINPGKQKYSSITTNPPVSFSPPVIEKVFTKIEKTASFPGGQTAWLKYISRVFEKNGNELMSDKNNQGTCKVRFIVSKDGKVSDVQAINMKGTELADVAVNAIKKGPAWNAGTQNGHAVNSYVLVPVTFKLNDNLMIKNEPE